MNIDNTHHTQETLLFLIPMLKQIKFNEALIVMRITSVKVFIYHQDITHL